MVAQNNVNGLHFSDGPVIAGHAVGIQAMVLLVQLMITFPVLKPVLRRAGADRALFGTISMCLFALLATVVIVSIGTIMIAVRCRSGVMITVVLSVLNMILALWTLLHWHSVAA